MVNGEWRRRPAAGADRLPARCTGLLLLGGAIALLSACRGGDEPMLRPAESVRVGEAARTLAIDAQGRWWLGEAGGLVVRDSAAGERRIALPGTAAPTVVGWNPAGSWLRWGDSVAVVDADGDSLRALRPGFGAAVTVPDRRGRALFQGARSGAVLLHDPTSLEPVAAWAALARRTTALATAPEGDRLYQAVEVDGDAAILVRDLQTGRILSELPLAHAIGAIAAGEGGILYVAAVRGRRLSVTALATAGGERREVWAVRRGVAGAGGAGIAVRLSDGVLAVGARGEGAFVWLVDPADGAWIGRAPGEPIDFDLAPEGELWALYAGEVRRLRRPRRISARRRCRSCAAATRRRGRGAS